MCMQDAFHFAESPSERQRNANTDAVRVDCTLDNNELLIQEEVWIMLAKLQS